MSRNQSYYHWGNGTQKISKANQTDLRVWNGSTSSWTEVITSPRRSGNRHQRICYLRSSDYLQNRSMWPLNGELSVFWQQRWTVVKLIDWKIGLRRRHRTPVDQTTTKNQYRNAKNISSWTTPEAFMIHKMIVIHVTVRNFMTIKLSYSLCSMKTKTKWWTNHRRRPTKRQYKLITQNSLITTRNLKQKMRDPRGPGKRG